MDPNTEANVPERLEAVGKEIVKGLDDVRSEVAADRRWRRISSAVLALVLTGAIVVGFVVTRNIREDARERCIGINTSRQNVVRGFELNADGLLAAFDIDRDNPPDPSTETGAGVATYLAAQEEIVDGFHFDDCNGDGEVDTDDGFDQSLSPFEAQP